MSKTLVNTRREFVMLLEAINSNPNGNPDNGNLPKQDPVTGQGLLSATCLKSKIRKHMALMGLPVFYGPICMEAKQEEIYEAAGLNNGKAKLPLAEKKVLAAKHVLKNFRDIPLFGGLLDTGASKCGSFHGAVVITESFTLDPVQILMDTHAHQSIALKKDRDKQMDENGSWKGPLSHQGYIRYGLFRIHGYVDAYRATQNGVTEGDLESMFDALINLWDHDRSAARGELVPRKLVVFQHDNQLGRAPSRLLLERLTAVKAKEMPSSYADYTVGLDSTKMPRGVAMTELL